tara:strand:+ start:69197 stop:70063 length:867 start_codon:yes stop_codon:yes gene_type:complete
MIKKYSFLLAFLIVSSSTIFSQKLENSTLWEITGNGLDKPSYLFGTIHITCDATLSKEVKEALNETSQVVLEIDMDDPTMQSKMMSGMFMKDNKTLKDFVTDTEYTMIDSLFIKTMGMPVKMMERTKPFFLSSVFVTKLLDCPMQSFETELMKVAKEQNEDVKGLETIEDQLQVFDEIPYEVQIKELVRTAKDNLVKDKANMKVLLNLYNEQDITRLLEMMNDDEAGALSDFNDILLDNRNKNWIPRIGEYAKEKPTFFGVGAGHLAGKNGVILLLRKAGYTVTAIQQ